MPPMDSHWKSRGYLPHFDDGKTTQTLTFRLKDSYPKSFQDECRKLLRETSDKDKTFQRLRERAERVLDKGFGSCFLKRPALARFVQDEFLRHHGERYFLHGWVIMPNHVHVMLTQLNGWSIEAIIKEWRQHTGRLFSRILREDGPFWSRGNYDRYVRSRKHFDYFMGYMELNPVKARLCPFPKAWPWCHLAFHLDGNGMWIPGWGDGEDLGVGVKPAYRVYSQR